MLLIRYINMPTFVLLVCRTHCKVAVDQRSNVGNVRSPRIVSDDERLGIFWTAGDSATCVGNNNPLPVPVSSCHLRSESTVCRLNCLLSKCANSFQHWSQRCVHCYISDAQLPIKDLGRTWQRTVAFENLSQAVDNRVIHRNLVLYDIEVWHGMESFFVF